METLRKLLRAADRILGAAVGILFILCFAVALWSTADIFCIYRAAGSETYTPLKPTAVSTSDEPGTNLPGSSGGETAPGQAPAADFSALLEINPDVAGWLTLDGTGIDYPILHGETNIEYINTDLYGRYTLSGSIFLDYRSSRGFTDALSVIHGHHMQGGAMFGDLDLYREQSFLDANHSGTLCTPEGGAQEIELVACIMVSAYDLRIFGKPESFTDAAAVYDELLYGDGTQLLTFRTPSAPIGSGDRLLAFATCSDTAPNDRTVVIGVIRR